MSGLESRMVDYARGLRYDQLPAAAIHHGKRRVIDTLGARSPLTRRRRSASRAGWRCPGPARRGARVWGSLVRTSPDAAAFVNGSMLRYLDINDTYRTVDGSHPSDNLGGIVAVAEMLGASGKDLLLALTISYELQCRFVDSVPFNDNGWDQPVPGVMACALACGRLLDLSGAEMHEALALAIIPNLKHLSEPRRRTLDVEGGRRRERRAPGRLRRDARGRGHDRTLRALRRSFRTVEADDGQGLRDRSVRKGKGRDVRGRTEQHQEVPGTRFLPVAGRHRQGPASEARRDARSRPFASRPIARRTRAQSRTRSSGRRRLGRRRTTQCSWRSW